VHTTNHVSTRKAVSLQRVPKKVHHPSPVIQMIITISFSLSQMDCSVALMAMIVIAAHGVCLTTSHHRTRSTDGNHPRSVGSLKWDRVPPLHAPETQLVTTRCTDKAICAHQPWHQPPRQPSPCLQLSAHQCRHRFHQRCQTQP